MSGTTVLFSHHSAFVFYSLVTFEARTSVAFVWSFHTLHLEQYHSIKRGNQTVRLIRISISSRHYAIQSALRSFHEQSFLGTPTLNATMRKL